MKPKIQLFHVHIIAEGKYTVRVDGFQIHFTTDKAEADRVVKALNAAFAESTQQRKG